jgi:hypothetical protein
MVTTRRRIGWRVPLLGALLLLLVVGFVKQQALADWMRLRGYMPTTQVQNIVSADAFTPNARHLFYINRPTVVAKAGFASHCSSQSEETIVLGCYHGVQRGIYVLRIADDSRLDGVMQVTSAHEMLHAAYDRLSDSERSKVDAQLNDYYAHGLKDERIKATIEAYKTSEPNAVPNEMHSVFGTEVSSLPPDLEKYYTRYFTDRAKVVALAHGYQAEFVKRQDEVKQYDERLSELKDQISQNESRLKLQATSLKDQSSALDRLRNEGKTTEYNSKVTEFNAQVSDYNSQIQSTKSLISEYNQLVETRNSIALEQQELVKELSGENLQSVR